MSAALPAEAISIRALPLPGPAVISQRWRDAVFLHWRVDPQRVQPLLPRGTRPDEFAGSSWVGLIAFRLERSAFGTLPPVPWLGTFLELNVRLYSVDEEGRRGVVFRTLEAQHLLPVLTANAALGLPYRWARMRTERRHAPRGEEYAFASDRIGAPLRTRIKAVLHEQPVIGDPLADFLTARWAMHVERFGRTSYWRNEHEPWPLRRATLLGLEDDLIAHCGLPGITDAPPASVLWSPGVATRFAAPAG